MNISPRGLALTKHWEGLKLQAYDDATDRIVKPGDPIYGTLTNGYGHTSAAGPPDVYIGQVWTLAYAERVLLSDMAAVELQVEHSVKVPLNQNQFDALCDFQFNVGWLTHQHCSLLTALNAGNYELADQDFMLYDRAQGKVLVGLDRRRAAEKTLFAMKEVPTMATGAAQTIEDILKLFEEVDPLLAAIPGIGPLLPFINTLLPIAIQAVDTVSKATGDSTAIATTAVVNHLTPGKPNTPALNG